MKIQIKNGRLIDPASGKDTREDVYVDAGRIAALGRAPGGFRAERTIDAE